MKYGEMMVQMITPAHTRKQDKGKPMGNLPSGTVTFLFTDIEGSTKLAQSLGDKWETLRSRHHEILRTSIEANNGYVFQIIGDAFCASFHNAVDALQSSIQAQTELQNEK